jgi:hypothetical protein
MPRSKPTTIRLTIARVGSRRFELRDHRGMVLDTVDTRLAALDLVNAMKRQCDGGWRIEVSWHGCEAP